MMRTCRIMVYATLPLGHGSLRAVCLSYQDGERRAWIVLPSGETIQDAEKAVRIPDAELHALGVTFNLDHMLISIKCC